MRLAATPKEIFGEITPPKELAPFIDPVSQGGAGLSKFFSNVVFLMYEVALLAATLYLVWGAVEWILSGGDKEKVAEARKRITYAITGLILLGIVFAVLSIFKVFTGFDKFGT